MNFFSTFRGKLLVVLAVLLIATLGVQYYLNLRTQRENRDLREQQERILVDAISLGFASITLQEERMLDLVTQPGQKFLNENAQKRVRNILIIDNDREIYDSLDPAYLPVENEDGSYKYWKLSEIPDLPPVMEVDRLGEDIVYFPQGPASAVGDEAHAIPIETTKGRWYVMVVLRNDLTAAAWRAAQPLVYTLGILLVSTLITFYLVWRFTRPIANLSNAAKRVAEGDLTVRVPDDTRSDEMGRLAQRFNEMVRVLEKSKELEEQLQQAEKSAVIGRLGSAIAHEIRNPLNYINLTLDHLRAKFSPEDPGDQATFRKLTSQLKAEVARINQQITDFLSYSRPVKADLREIEIRKVVEDSLRIVEAEAEEKKIKIGIVEHEDVPKVTADPDLLRSVFNNLFINAVQAMETAGGTLSVRISPGNGDGMVKVEIADTGTGISEENLEKIFEPYFSTKETGTGLGLAIVQKTLDMHRGQIEVESDVDKGTRFTVRLPSAPAGDNGGGVAQSRP